MVYNRGAEESRENGVSPMNNSVALSILAVEKIINNLANSNFSLRCGKLAVEELRSIKIDLIIDIAEVIEGREMTTDEQKAIFP